MSGNRPGIDIDTFVAAHQASWERLDALTTRARTIRGLRGLDADETDELVLLYQRCGTHLATARVRYAGDRMLVDRLTLLVGEAHAVIHGQRRGDTRRTVAAFATRTFPAAVWSLRPFIVVAALCTFVPWAIFQVWLSVSPRAFDLIAPDAVKQAYIERDFAEYYSSQPAQNFATQVFLNNVRVAFLAFAAGILLCVGTMAILAVNGANGGIAGGMFAHVGQAGVFWGLILPHGLLELSAVVVAGAAGMRIGWTVIDPGDRLRREALASEARRAGNVLIGLVAAFLLAAAVEGFVTGRPWPTMVRVGIGVAVFLGFWGLTIAYAWRTRGDEGFDAVADARHLGDGDPELDTRPAGLTTGRTP
jgi:uncharacterized membrane protein SpoIIM required for sporulation